MKESPKLLHQTALLLIQFPANAPQKIVKDDPNNQASPPRWEIEYIYGSLLWPCSNLAVEDFGEAKGFLSPSSFVDIAFK